MADKLRFGIIGCGRVSPKHVEALANNFSRAELVALCDLEEEKAHELKHRYKDQLETKGFDIPEITTYTDYLQMLSRHDIDVVSIATYSGTHARIALDALQAGKHVIVEKPMALSTVDAQQMIDVAMQTGKKLTVCHQNRFNPPVRKLREALEQGRFGKLVHGVAVIRWNRNEEYYKQAAWRGTWEQDGGVLMNQGIHDIDLLQWMMGPLSGSTLKLIHSLDLLKLRTWEQQCLGSKNGAIGIIEGSACIYPKNLEETLSIFGERGTVRIGGVALNKILEWKFADGLDDEEQVKQ